MIEPVSFVVGFVAGAVFGIAGLFVLFYYVFRKFDQYLELLMRIEWLSEAMGKDRAGGEA